MKKVLHNIVLILHVLRNMGIRYVLFRAKYEFLRKTGVMKYFYPADIHPKGGVSLAQWRSQSGKFFFSGRELPLRKKVSEKLASDTKKILNGSVPFFSSFWVAPEQVCDWTRHPETGYRLGADKHWTQFESLNPASGDIKYVWERARFSHLLTVMRYDSASGEDHSAFVIGEIMDFIRKNPLNMGPNYVCSQEISIRLMNWLFLLNFYKNSPEMTEECFAVIIKSIYGQLRHVYSNIDFSCIAVRNNHAITECTMLFAAGLLFPGFKDAKKWKKEGLKRLEKEVAYQIYQDGSHLQFSTNYHRVVLQTLTFVIALMQCNDHPVPDVLTEKFCRSLEFLFCCQDSETGWLPNYGANDGALFFPLSDCDYRDYRPQLDAAYYLVSGKDLYAEKFEDRTWFCSASKPVFPEFELSRQNGVFCFPNGGVYVIRDQASVTLFKCGSYSVDRPSHADGLHIDIWVDGKNVLPDGGSFKYNTDSETLRYFWGTESHNTVMLGDCDQMKKGARFIWYHWIDQAECKVNESEKEWILTGKIHAFQHIRKDIFVTRQIRKVKGENQWHIVDRMEYDDSIQVEMPELRQLWHTRNSDEVILESAGNRIEKRRFISEYYGRKDSLRQIEICTNNQCIETIVKVNVK